MKKVDLHHLKYYLSKKIERVEDADSLVGIIQGNNSRKAIKINFDHYLNFDEAIRKWEERKRRINWDNIYVMMEFYDGIQGDEWIERFGRVNHDHKMILTHRDHKEEYTRTIHCFNDNLDMNEVGGKIFRYDGLTGKRYYDEFDYVEFLNQK